MPGKKGREGRQQRLNNINGPARGAIATVLAQARASLKEPLSRPYTPAETRTLHCLSRRIMQRPIKVASTVPPPKKILPFLWYFLFHIFVLARTHRSRCSSFSPRWTWWCLGGV